MALAGVLWCPARPWDTKGPLVKAPAPGQRSDPVGLELESGERCERTGRWSYDCGAGLRLSAVAKAPAGRVGGLVTRGDRTTPVVVKTVWLRP